MEILRRAYCFLRDKYRLLSLKKYSTLAGTLVFFLIMSIVPLTFWLTLFIGKLPISVEQVFRLSIFSSVRKVFDYIRQEAENATAGVSVLLLITSLYSATTLFYQMRRSGEIIYDFHPQHQGMRLRLGALLLLVIVMSTVIIFLLVFAFGSLLFSRIFSRRWEMVSDYLLLTIVAFLLDLLLNMYICPHKAKITDFLPGTLITVGLWAVAVAGFSVYLKIGNLGRLYGALSAVIVFLLWLYVMMICFIIGVIWNSERVLQKNKSRIKKKKHPILPT